MQKSYLELRSLKTFEERFEYLRLFGSVGQSTFGFDRYMNQAFYNSREWRILRNKIIVRDNACDLGIQGRDIFRFVIVHHINPITAKDLENANSCAFDPNNLICVSDITHKAIHYGNLSLVDSIPKERKRGDTCLWE